MHQLWPSRCSYVFQLSLFLFINSDQYTLLTHFFTRNMDTSNSKVPTSVSLHSTSLLIYKIYSVQSNNVNAVNRQLFYDPISEAIHFFHYRNNVRLFPLTISVSLFWLNFFFAVRFQEPNCNFILILCFRLYVGYRHIHMSKIIK